MFSYQTGSVEQQIRADHLDWYIGKHIIITYSRIIYTYHNIISELEYIQTDTPNLYHRTHCEMIERKREREREGGEKERGREEREGGRTERERKNIGKMW